MKQSNHCSRYKGMPTNEDLCARLVLPDTGPRAVSQFEPFCSLTHEPCPSNGQRLMPRADSDGDAGEV